MVTYADTNLPSIAEIRSRWCFGLPLYDSTGIAMDDAHIQQALDSAIARVERHLGIYLKPTVICSNAEERGLVKGFDYEVSEPAYDYESKAYANWGFLQLRERPAHALKGLKLVLPNGQIIIDFMINPDWVKFYPKQAQIQIVPYAGNPTIFAILGGSQTSYPFVSGQLYANMPQVWYIDYTAGYPLGEVPYDIRDVVAKIAAIDVLGLAGEGLKAGVTNISTSIDGLSESVGTTVSASSTLYGGHIAQFQGEVDKFFEGGARSSERGLTMTFL